MLSLVSNTISNLQAFCLGVLCLCSLAVDAQQDAGRQRFLPEVILGLSSSQVSGDQLRGFDQLGISSGIGVLLNTPGMWRPGIDILFTQKGSRKNARPDEGDFDSYLLRLNYVQVPLYMSYQRESIGFDVGASYGTLLSFREEDQNGNNIGRDFESGELSAILGIRYQFAPKWTLTTRLDQSISQIRRHSGAAVFRLNRGQYNTAILFQLRYQPLGN